MVYINLSIPISILKRRFTPPTPRPSKTENPVTFFLRNNLFIRNPYTPYNLPFIIKSYLNSLRHSTFYLKILKAPLWK
eukprot:UN00238